MELDMYNYRSFKFDQYVCLDANGHFINWRHG